MCSLEKQHLKITIVVICGVHVDINTGKGWQQECSLQVDIHRHAVAADKQSGFRHHEPWRQSNKTGDMLLTMCSMPSTASSIVHDIIHWSMLLYCIVGVDWPFLDLHKSLLDSCSVLPKQHNLSTMI